MSVLTERNYSDCSIKSEWFYTCLLILFALCSLNPVTSHAAERQNLFDWYYSAVFGTGSYRIGERDVFVVTAPYSRTWREATEDKHEIVLSLPVTLGFYDYTVDDIADLDIPTDVATLTFFPGIHYVIPLSHDWTIKPFANLGYGKEFDGGEEAWIYSAGVRSLYQVRDDQWRIALGSALYYAGNTRKDQTDLGFAALELAVDANRATDMTVDGEKVYVGGYAAVYLFSNLEFIQSDETTFTLNEQYEVGLTLSTRDQVDFLGLEFDRIGIGYLSSSGFRAWRLVFSFPY
jgi:hypothetical protein